MYDGVELEELWRVGRGEVNFGEFRQKYGLDVATPPPPPPVATTAPPPPVVEEKPREEVAEKLPPPPPAPVDVEIGTSQGLKGLDVRSLIKPSPVDVPLLSEEKKKEKEKPMDYIVQNAAVDSTTKWRRVYNLGSQSEIFVSVNQEVEQGPFVVTFTSDAAFPLILHWGVGKTGRGRNWEAPSEDLFPVYLTEMTEDKKAAETALGDCHDDECDIELIGAKVPLQRARVKIPWDAGISNVLFVLRSADRSRWYKDGHNNFTVPLPGRSIALPDSRFLK